MSDDITPPCLVCGEHEAPRSAAVVSKESGITLASLCENAEWCQARAAARLLKDLSLRLLDGDPS